VDDDDKNDEHHVETLPKKKQKPDEDIDANDKEEDVDALPCSNLVERTSS
jgi:hypothetical protein